MPLTRCPELDEENPVSLRGVYTRIAELSAHNFTRQNTRVYHFRCTVHNRRREAAPAVALKTPASFHIANQIPVHRPGLEFRIRGYFEADFIVVASMIPIHVNSCSKS